MNETTLFSLSLQSIQLKPAPLEVHLVQRRLALVDVIEVPHPAPQPGVHRRTRSRCQSRLAVVVPLAPLAELAAHEQQLLARDARTCSRRARAASRASASRSPGILSSIERLPCTTSSCENGRTKFSVNAYSIENVIWSWCQRRCTGSCLMYSSMSCIQPMFHL